MGGLVVTLGVTTWLFGASSSSGVQLVPVPGPPASVPAAVAAAGQAARRGAGGEPGRAAPSTVGEAAYAQWAEDTYRRTGVPARALAAYAEASARVAVESPGCHLSWTTLAGVGSVESRNGGDGEGLQPDGRPVVAIYGPALDGAGDVAAVGDTDGGALDGSATLDRAVGPLQFLPSTWRAWGSDGDGDGVSDPQDIDDAALTAGRYLCASGDLADATGWTDAVLSYNHSTDYLEAVYGAAQQIATASAG